MIFGRLNPGKMLQKHLKDLSSSPVRRSHLTDKVDKSVSCLCQIFSGFNVPKITKNRLIFDSFIQKIVMWTFFSNAVYKMFCIVVTGAPRSGISCRLTTRQARFGA